FNVSGVWTNSGTGAPSVTWTATGGSISSGGKYTAGSTTGTFRVIAAALSGTLADTSAITITPLAPSLTGIKLSPIRVTLQAGGTQQFSVQGAWSDGGSPGPAGLSPRGATSRGAHPAPTR